MQPISKEWHSAVLSRIKVLSELDIAERRVPQDGRFRVKYKGRFIDLRVSIMTAPNIGGTGLPGGQQPIGQSLGQAFGQAANQIMGNSAGMTPGGVQTPQGQLGGVSADTTEPGSASSTDPSDTDTSENAALLNSEPRTVMGGNIIGVGSRINHRSLLVYDKAKNYRQFEFIWDPSKDVMVVGSAPPAGATPAGQQPQQQTPFGQQGVASPNSPVNPSPIPPDTTPDQPPQEP